MTCLGWCTALRASLPGRILDVSDEAKDVYAQAVVILERSLADAARSQWAGQRPDLHRDRRALIELRRSVPNDRLDPCNQVIRDLLTAYATLLDEQASRDSYERDVALSEEMKSELDRLRPRAARQGLPVVSADLRGFKVSRPREPSPVPAAVLPHQAPPRRRSVATGRAPGAGPQGRRRTARRPSGLIVKWRGRPTAWIVLRLSALPPVGWLRRSAPATTSRPALRAGSWASRERRAPLALRVRFSRSLRLV